MEDDLHWKMTVNGRLSLMQEDPQWKTSLNTLQWMTNFNGKRPSMEDNLTFNGRQLSREDNLQLKI